MKKLVLVYISIQQFPIYSEVLLVPQQYPKIQWAIDASSKNDTILVSSGIYYENINFLGKSIVVKANGPADLVVIDGSQPIDPDNSSVVKFVTTEGDVVATLDGFTITGGTGSWSWPGKVGGGIFIENAQAVIKNCIIKNNTAVKGGGISCGYDYDHQYLNSCVIINCVVENNTSQFDGSGIYVNFYASIDLDHCTIANNNFSLSNTAAAALSSISNTIIWFGTATIVYDGPSEFIYCDIQGGWSSGVGNIDSNPMFCDANLSDYHIALNSPCVGAGENGTNIGALGTCGQEYSRFNYPLEIGTTWTYKYDYDYSHLGDWSKRHGIHIWSVIDSSIFLDDSIRFTIASKNIDTVSSSYNPTPTLKIDTTYFYIDRGQNTIVVRPPSNVYPIVDNITGYFSGDQTLQIGGRVYKEGLGLFSLYFFNMTNTYYRELLELIEFNGTPVNVFDDDEFQTEPIGFNLKQNYPNPFNPSTKISWQSPVSSWQTLKVYDVLGNEIATLVDEYRNGGNYEIEFNASQLASGIYFYQLKAGDPSTSSGQSFVETKKMILLK